MWFVRIYNGVLCCSSYAMRFCAILCNEVLYGTMQRGFIRYYATRFYTVLCNEVLYGTIQWGFIRYYAMRFYTVLCKHFLYGTMRFCAILGFVRYYTMRFCAILCNEVLCDTIQWGLCETMQWGFIQYYAFEVLSAGYYAMRVWRAICNDGVSSLILGEVPFFTKILDNLLNNQQCVA